MPIGILNQPTLSPGSPFSGAFDMSNALNGLLKNLMSSQKLKYMGPSLQAALQQQQLANQVTQAKLPYVGPEEAAGLLQTQLGNQRAQALLPYAVPTAQADIKEKLAMSGLYGQEAQKDAFETQMNKMGLSILQGQKNQPQSKINSSSDTQNLPNYLSANYQMNPQSQNTSNALGATQSPQPMQPTFSPIQQAILAKTGFKIPDQEPLSSIGKAINDYNKALQLYGPNDVRTVEIKNYINRLSAGNPGLSISGMPGGGFTITQGGVLPTTINGSTDQNGNIVMSPASPHGRYTTAGATLVNPQTGDAISVPTEKTASQLQSGMTSDEIVPPILKKSYNDIAPLIGASNSLNRLGSQIGQVFGNTNQTYAKYLSGIKTEIPQSADLLLKSMNLNNNADNRKAMQASIEPHWDDTKESYARRIADTVASMMVREKQYKKYLKQGISLQDIPSESNIAQMYSDKIYSELTNNQNDQVSIQSPDGRKFKVPRKNLNKLMSDHPNVKVIS